MIGAAYRIESDGYATARWMVLASALGLTMLSGVLALIFADSGSDRSDAGPNWSFILAVTVVWIMLLVVWLGPTGRTRCNRFALALPLASRRLWRNQTVSVALFGGAVVLISSVALVILDRQVERALARPLFHEPGVGGLIWLLVSGLVLNLGLVQSRRLELSRLPGSVKEVLTVVGTSLAVLVVLLFIGGMHWSLSLAPCIAGIVLILRAERNVPACFSIVPARPEDAPGGPARSGTAGASVDLPAAPRAPRAARGSLVSRIALINTVHRAMAKLPSVRWMPLPFMALMGVILSGWYSGVMGGSEIRLMYVALAAYCALAFVVGPLSYLFMIDAYPISRRTIFAVIMLPTFLSLFAGYGAGHLWSERVANRTDQIRELGDRSDYLFSIPLAFGDIAQDGVPGEVQSPWGESHPAWNAHPFAGSRTVVFSPFTAPRQASPAFAALQVSRAVERIYGARIPWRELEARYFQPGLDGSTSIRPGGLTLLQDYPELTRRSGHGPMFPVIMLPLCLLTFASIAVYFRWFRAGVKASRRKTVFFLLLALLLALHLSFLALEIAGWLELEVLDAYVAIQTARVGELPGGSFAVWAIGFALLAVGYRALESRFARIEAISTGADLWFPLMGMNVED